MDNEIAKDIQPRKDFYAKELNLDRMNKVLEYVISTLTLQEILKMIREISYDMVCYYDKDLCARIYKDKEYSKLNREQACRLQRLLSSACDLFGQSVIDKREFDEGYLHHWLDGGAMEIEIGNLKQEIERLNLEIGELMERKEVIGKAINWIIKYQTEWCQEDEVIRDLKQLLNILNGE